MKRTYIVCPKCGKTISKSNYSKHQRRHETHPETFKEKSYKLTHDDLSCKFCGKLCKNVAGLISHERQCISNPNRQADVNGFFQHNTKIALGEISVWNKGLTKEIDSRVAQGVRVKQNRRALGLYKDTSGENNISKNPQVRAKISATCLAKSREGTWHASLAKNKRIIYRGVELHCSWELHYAIYLDDHNIEWIRCSERFPYYYKGAWHYYTPDFYLLQTEEYVEIKGYATERDHAKWKHFPKDKKLLILREIELNNLGIDTKEISSKPPCLVADT